MQEEETNVKQLNQGGRECANNRRVVLKREKLKVLQHDNIGLTF